MINPNLPPEIPSEPQLTFMDLKHWGEDVWDLIRQIPYPTQDEQQQQELDALLMETRAHALIMGQVMAYYEEPEPTPEELGPESVTNLTDEELTAEIKAMHQVHGPRHADLIDELLRRDQQRRTNPSGAD
jgi:hypothetical protein